MDIHHQFNLSTFKGIMSDLVKWFLGVVFPNQKEKNREMNNAETIILYYIYMASHKISRVDARCRSCKELGTKKKIQDINIT